MCGIFFEFKQNSNLLSSIALEKQCKRGPDNTNLVKIDDNAIMGHNRLAIIDQSAAANQPFVVDGRYYIVYNGEIYNYVELAKKYKIDCTTSSDTEVLLKLYLQQGIDVLNEIIGMFSFILYDRLTAKWIAVRDQFGIKPLYYIRKGDGYIFASEVSSLLEYSSRVIDHDSILEWRKFRRPLLGHTFYSDIYEFPAASWMSNDGKFHKYFEINQSDAEYNEEYLEFMLKDLIRIHTVSDVPVASLISGGVDSNVVAMYSNPSTIYTTGLLENNESVAVRESNQVLCKPLVEKYISIDELYNEWALLTKYKCEPIFVPNEGLISSICSTIKEKVVLTGEGADEVFFGYDKIFSAAVKYESTDFENFLNNNYVYSDCHNTLRMADYLNKLASGKSTIDALEDFFLEFHLSCLLRRMDFSSMYASKEARVPFVNIQLISYMYRRKYDLRLKNGVSKYFLRGLLNKSGLSCVAKIPKVGFEAKNKNGNQLDHYKDFQNKILEALQW